MPSHVLVGQVRHTIAAHAALKTPKKTLNNRSLMGWPFGSRMLEVLRRLSAALGCICTASQLRIWCDVGVAFPHKAFSKGLKAMAMLQTVADALALAECLMPK